MRQVWLLEVLVPGIVLAMSYREKASAALLREVFFAEVLAPEMAGFPHRSALWPCRAGTSAPTLLQPAFLAEVLATETFLATSFPSKSARAGDLSRHLFK